MNQEQYRRLQENRRRRGPRALGEAWQSATPERTALTAIISRAARVHRRREAAAAAWQRIVEPSWAADTAIQGLLGDTLYVAVASSALAYTLERRRLRLEKSMASMVPGVRRIRILFEGHAVAGPQTEH